MNNTLNRFRDMDLKVLDANRTELVGSDCETREVESDTSAFAKYLEFLHETIDRLECENSEARRRIKELQANKPRSRNYIPTKLAQDILLRFCDADTTELREAEIIEMCAEGRGELQGALSDLCDHQLLAMEKTRNDTRYVITTEGQNLCFSSSH
jgi:hypothetical protein